MSTDVTPPSAKILFGLDEAALITVPEHQCRLHARVMESFVHLCDSARAAGFSLCVASSYRSFERQRLIWNAKAQGERPVLDDCGQPLDLTKLTDEQKVHAILRWSALPGASRHHWGTDMDVYDSLAVSEDYRLQLTVEECCDSGPFAPFHAWLTRTIAEGNSFGFYRPYAVDQGGIAPEPWHLSFAPLADEFARQRTELLLRTQIEATDILLKAAILENFSTLYQRYILIKN